MLIYKNCRNEFLDAITKVFNDTTTFLDFIENEEYSNNYDYFISCSDECYIINRSTGEYINWYKFNHLGRDIHTTVKPYQIKDFLQEFYDSRYFNIEVNHGTSI